VLPQGDALRTLAEKPLAPDHQAPPPSRAVLNYSASELQRAQQCVSRLNEFVTRLRHFQPGRRCPDLDQALYE